MSSSAVTCVVSKCSGCFPRYEPNQMAHMEPGGCLYCDYIEEEKESLTAEAAATADDPFESFIEALFDEEKDSLVVEGGLESLFDDEKSESEQSQGDKDSTETECCICYESIDKIKNNCTTECGHTFCLKCLMTSMMHDNFACPCCRADLVDMPEEEEDSDEEEGEDEDEDDDEELEEETECDIDELTRRLTNNGFKMQDILSMLMGRYIKGMPDLNIHELNKKFDDIVTDADNEALEMEEMGQEDLRTIALVVA